MHAILATVDDAGVRQPVQQALGEGAGWAVLTVPDGATLFVALDKVRPDLILLDVNMSDITGRGVYWLLRRRKDTRAVPVLFLTSVPQKAVVGLPGPCAWLAKPLAIDALLAQVAALLVAPLA